MSPADSRLNLDALRAPSRKVQFLGVEFELGYIPAGASIPLTEGYNRMLSDQTKAMGGTVTPDAEAAYREAHAEEIASANIGYVAKFCAFYDASFTHEKVAMEATREMVDAFYVEIIRALMEAASKSKDSAGGEKKRPDWTEALDRLSVLYGVDEAYMLRNWSVETMGRKLVHGVEFDLMRRGLLSEAKPKKLAVLPKSEVGAEFKEFLPQWLPR